MPAAVRTTEQQSCGRARVLLPHQSAGVATVHSFREVYFARSLSHRGSCRFTEKQAERTVDDLLAAGFSNDDISVLLPNNQGSKDYRAQFRGTQPKRLSQLSARTGWRA